MTKAGCDFCKLPRKTTEEEVTTSLAEKEVSLAVLLELDVIFTLKEEQRAALEAFLSGKAVVVLLLTGFGNRSAEHCGTSWLVTGW